MTEEDITLEIPLWIYPLTVVAILIPLGVAGYIYLGLLVTFPVILAGFLVLAAAPAAAAGSDAACFALWPESRLCSRSRMASAGVSWMVFAGFPGQHDGAAFDRSYSGSSL